MTTHRGRPRLSIPCLTILLLLPPGTPARSQGSAASLPTGEEVFALVEKSLDGVSDYTVSLDVNVNLDRLKVPGMHATMYFKKPDKVHFDAENFAMLPREGVAFNASKLLARYSVENVEERADSSCSGLNVTLVPKSDRVRMRRIAVCVRPGRWTVERFSSPLPDGRSMTASFTYQQIDGHWLPSGLVVLFSTTETDTSDAAPADQLSPGRRPSFPQTGTITVRYSDYRVNTGLSDTIFEKK